MALSSPGAPSTMRNSGRLSPRVMRSSRTVRQASALSPPMLLIASSTFWPSSRTPRTTSSEMEVAWSSTLTGLPFFGHAKPETPVLDLAPGQVAQSHERDSRFRSRKELQPCRLGADRDIDWRPSSNHDEGCPVIEFYRKDPRPASIIGSGLPIDPDHLVPR